MIVWHEGTKWWSILLHPRLEIAQACTAVSDFKVEMCGPMLDSAENVVQISIDARKRWLHTFPHRFPQQ